MPVHSLTHSIDIQNENVPCMARGFGSSIILLTFCFTLNNWLTHVAGFPGLGHVFNGGGLLALLQLALYCCALIFSWWSALRTPEVKLRVEAARVYALSAFLVRGAFFAVLYIGIVDFILSFLQAEELLASIFGERLAIDMRLPSWRGVWIHIPLAALGFLTAMRARTLGFHWLTFMIVLSELLIVLSRFIFSYEQSFMSDLVRFWYAALFLFSSAYTLLDEGHVRVDVLYAGMSERQKGRVNAFGSIVLGMVFCAVILFFGFASSSSTINGPLLNFEVSQSGVGMHIKYLMAGFIGVFAITMLIQFVAYFYDGLADWRGEERPRQKFSNVETKG